MKQTCSVVLLLVMGRGFPCLKCTRMTAVKEKTPEVDKAGAPRLKFLSRFDDHGLKIQSPRQLQLVSTESS